MSVVTRFAPSPTGFLHIGGARTALFNWLYARHHGGRFVLRIEDTDRRRSTPEAVRAILDGLAWLGLDGDGEALFQSGRAERHAAVVRGLLDSGHAYRCFCTPEELDAMREKARAAGGGSRYDGTWRDRDPAEAPPGVAPAIRFRAPQSGETVIEDLVQGPVRVANAELDDMILLRADGTPTYMVSVVIDDHDMGVSHVIRGDDHLTNAFRQWQLFHALRWEPPAFAHIPLIHGPDGAKLSKRHGALGVAAYRDMGFLPEALRNYLLRLGWSHGDDEIIDTDQAVAWFDLDSVGRSPARFDMSRLESLNAHYLRHADNDRLCDSIWPRIAADIPNEAEGTAKSTLLAGLDGLKQRPRTLVELAENARFYVAPRPIPVTAKAAKLLAPEARARLERLRDRLAEPGPWDESALEDLVRDFAAAEVVKLGQVAQPLRAALTGAIASPGIFEVMAVLGRDEVLGRLSDL